jgi:hypothetical protein
MFKPLSIFAALITFGTGSVSAQQREALLQTIEVPGADFDIALATPKTPGATIDLGKSPDALVIYLIGGELALGFESGEEMLKAIDSLRNPIGAFHIQSHSGGPSIPAAAYIAPRRRTLISTGNAAGKKGPLNGAP